MPTERAAAASRLLGLAGTWDRKRKEFQQLISNLEKENEENNDQEEAVQENLADARNEYMQLLNFQRVQGIWRPSGTQGSCDFVLQTMRRTIHLYLDSA